MTSIHDVAADFEFDFEVFTRQQEVDVICAFMSKYGSAGGTVPARKPYLSTRDSICVERAAFITVSRVAPRGMHRRANPNHGDYAVQSGSMESAQEAIMNGQRLGYRMEDIGAYLVRNYLPYMTEAELAPLRCIDPPASTGKEQKQ